MKDLLRGYAAGLFRVKLRRQVRNFLAGTVDCRSTQRDVLQRLLSLNESSQFSREYGLTGSLNVNEFRSRMPVSDYERFRPYIEELKRGRSEALLGPQNPLLMFALSSGTTAESKFIPVTQQFLDDYRRGWQIWGISAFDNRPGLRFTNMLQVTSDYSRFTTEAGIPCGNISGLATSQQRPHVRFLYTLPYLISKIPDPQAKYYAILRLALADDNVGMITTANPSTVLQLATLADVHKKSLIRDIANGTLSSQFDVPGNIRQALAKRFGHKRPRRAKDLQQIVERVGHLRFGDAWERMEQLAIWTGGSCAAYLSAVRKHFGPHVSIRDHGLHASEGRMTIPFNDECSDGVLEVATHFFEFIPEAEHGRPNPTVLEAHELAVGQDYYILLTTSSGLSRYDICDVVRCTGFMHTTPILRFLHKGAYISNLTGEKISESQVVEAIRGAIDNSSRGLTLFTVIPAWGEPPCYQLLMENVDLLTLGNAEQMLAQADARLQSLNCEYQEKRQTGRLAPMRLVRLQDGAWQKFARQRQAKLGGSIEQYKHPCLIPDLEVVAREFRDYILP